MAFSERFFIQDEGSFVKDFDLSQQQLIMTQDWCEAHLFTLVESLEVVERLGWLASERLVLKAVEGAA